jgi:hypothetical protein
MSNHPNSSNSRRNRVRNIVGFIAGLIAIFVFITGYTSIPEIVASIFQNKSNFLPTSTQTANHAETKNPIPSAFPTNTSTPSPTKTPKPTLTQTSRPTVSPTSAKETEAAPISTISEDELIYSLLLDSSQLPSNFRFGERDTRTNKEVAENFDNPVEMLASLEAIERDKSIISSHYNEDYTCNNIPQIAGIIQRVIRHHSNKGVADSLTSDIWGGSIPKVTSNGIGEISYHLVGTEPTGCENNSSLQHYSLYFVRFNVAGNINVYGSGNESELKNEAERLAKQLDLNIVFTSQE